MDLHGIHEDQVTFQSASFTSMSISSETVSFTVETSQSVNRP